MNFDVIEELSTEEMEKLYELRSMDRKSSICKIDIDLETIKKEKEEKK